MSVLRLSREVEAAVADGGPVVALETTLVAHGFPGRDGLEVGLECEARVRAAGAIPATVGVLDGVVRVGLDEGELERFADPDARKAGPRDLAACAASGELGATTVGGTLAACRAAGIRFMGTGGLGRRPPRLDGAPRRLGRPRRACADAGARRRLGRRSPSSTCPRPRRSSRRWRFPCSGSGPTRCRSSTPPRAARRSRPASSRRTRRPRVARAHWELGRGGLLVGRPPDESLDVEALIAEGVEEAAPAGRPRPGGDAVPPLLPPRAKRRRDRRGEQAADRGQRRTRGRDRRSLLSMRRAIARRRAPGRRRLRRRRRAAGGSPGGRRDVGRDRARDGAAGVRPDGRNRSRSRFRASPPGRPGTPSGCG